MSRRRDWTPTGELVPVSNVSIRTRVRPQDKLPEKVIVTLTGRGERTKPFPTKTAAKKYHTKLWAAVYAGEEFDAGSFEPHTWGTPPASAEEVPADDRLRWVDYAAFHADETALKRKNGKTRSSRHEALRQVVWTLVHTAPGHPGRDALKAYLEVWLKPVPSDQRLTPVQRAEERGAVRADRLADLPDLVFARPGLRLPRAEVLAAGEWLHAHSEFVSNLTVAGVERVLDDFRVNLDGSPSAKNVRVRKRNVFHKVLDHAMKDELLLSNLMDKADTSDFRAGAVTPIDRRIVMDPVQAAAFLRNIGYDPATGQVENDDRYSAFVALMLFEGLRPSEASAVRADWLDLPMRGWGLLVLENATVQGQADWSDEGEVYSENPLKWSDHSSRNEKTRDVPLSPETVAILRRHLALYGTAVDGRLTSAREGGPMNSNLLSRLMEKARNRTFADLGSPLHIPRANHPLRSMTGYHCRHTAGSTMLNAGVPATLVAERMGHDVQVLLSTYAKVIEADKDRANGRIDTYRAEHFALAGYKGRKEKSGKKKAGKKKAKRQDYGDSRLEAA